MPNSIRHTTSRKDPENLAHVSDSRKVVGPVSLMSEFKCCKIKWLSSYAPSINSALYVGMHVCVFGGGCMTQKDQFVVCTRE